MHSSEPDWWRWLKGSILDLCEWKVRSMKVIEGIDLFQRFWVSVSEKKERWMKYILFCFFKKKWNLEIIFYSNDNESLYTCQKKNESLYFFGTIMNPYMYKRWNENKYKIKILEIKIKINPYKIEPDIWH